MNSDRIQSKASQRAARAAKHYESQARRASRRGPLDGTAVAFDEWRRRVADLPADIAMVLAAEMTALIKAETAKLRPADRGDWQ